MNPLSISVIKPVRSIKFGAQSQNEPKEASIHTTKLSNGMILLQSAHSRRIEKAQHAWCFEAIKETILPSLSKR